MSKTFTNVFHLLLVFPQLRAKPNPQQLEHHIRSHCGGSVYDLKLGLSTTTGLLWEATCTVETHFSSSVAIQNLRQAKSRTLGCIQVSLLTSEMASTRLEMTKTRNVPCQTSSQDCTANSKINEISFALFNLPPNSISKLKHHIVSHTGGKVTKLEMSRSSRGGHYASCVVQTCATPATAIDRLGKARFMGNIPQVVLHEHHTETPHPVEQAPLFTEVHTSKEPSIQLCTEFPLGPVASLALKKEGSLALLISNLPCTSTTILEHHIRSHSSGRVLSLEVTSSSRGGVCARCVVQPKMHPNDMLKRLAGARFQASLPRAQLLAWHRNEAMPSSLKMRQVPPHHDASSISKLSSSVAHDCVLNDESQSHNVASSTLSVPIKTYETTKDGNMDNNRCIASRERKAHHIRRCRDLIQPISTEFCRYVVSDPGRLNRADDGKMDDLFVSYLHELASTAARIRSKHDDEEDADSRTWAAHPPRDLHPENRQLLQTATTGASEARKDDATGDSGAFSEDAASHPESSDVHPNEVCVSHTPLYESQYSLNLEDAAEAAADIEEELGISRMSFVDVGRAMEWSMISKS